MTAQLMPLTRTKTAEPGKPSAKSGRSHSVGTLIYRAFLLLLSIATITALVMDAWSKLNPTTYDNTLMLPEWQELENQLITTPQRQKIPGYERDRFGRGWGQQGACSTREAVLLASNMQPRSEEYIHHSNELPQPTKPESCKIKNIEIWDEYAGGSISIIDSARHVDIDHIFPLSAAWDLGAHSWEQTRRQDFANDYRNLVPTDASANREKSDSLPNEWMPSDVSAHCWYARRVAYIAVLYELSIPEPDVKRMNKACRLFGLFAG
ncbi:HNH endonuclease family protein [Corynebacterium pseudodiphtheriticum]|uniref:HNH endonuclease family protein n=1 Tax=Corynebacterium pseudodiphtheriticum TaxID=37637 RepID=UPI00234C1FF4|nr:HNH endonuclease family protein [Corynebacterium pseudodiphtheriticum]MDC7088595.1 HNH endonuclease family protein [Corynebacterium pseudodiphtheriticum]MDK4241067.1 HNH endonuclease family protein [Corynebacterium pseudodiphtheriticum]MDK4320756.1 HNH endonuclease family protein [Corynebacterium pseudodiphtheriticum]